MSARPGIAGWDLGGAHLKVGLLASDGSLRQVIQLPTPLWRGVDHLDAAFSVLERECPLPGFRHAVTMTGELHDVFDSRAHGVQVLAERAAARLGDTRFFAGPLGFVDKADAVANADAVASANWYATAAWIAQQCPAGLLIDMGSTTTDILAVRRGRVDNRGYTDRERLMHDELVYTGVVRTPVMAVTQRMPFAGAWLQVANEHFATMADVYRVLGCLPAGRDQHASADGRDKGEVASMRRLARMLGADLDDADPDDWRQLAAYVADRQLDTLACACHRQLSRGLRADVPLIGAGSGSFVVERLAARLGRAYIDIADLMPQPLQGDLSAGTCAPAVAVALLADAEEVAWAC